MVPGTSVFLSSETGLILRCAGKAGNPFRTQNLSNIIKKHKAHTDTYLNPDRQKKSMDRGA